MKEIELIDISRDETKTTIIKGKKSLAIPKKGIQRLKEFYNSMKVKRKIEVEEILQEEPKQNPHKYEERQHELEKEGFGPFKTTPIMTPRTTTDHLNNGLRYGEKYKIEYEKALEESRILQEQIEKMYEEIESHKRSK